MNEDKAEWLGNVDTLAGFFNDMLIEDPDAMIPWTHLYAAFADWQRENGGKVWNKATFKNRIDSHRLFAELKSGKLRTSGMSLYCDEYGNSPKAPAGGRVAGLRGLRFRRPSDDVEQEQEQEQEQEELIPAEEIPTPTPTTAPEKDEVERCALVDECEGLVLKLCELPGGGDEVNRLVAETGCKSPDSPLGKLRAFKMRLEGALARLTTQQQKEMGIPFAEDNVHRQE